LPIHNGNLRPPFFGSPFDTAKFGIKRGKEYKRRDPRRSVDSLYEKMLGRGAATATARWG